MQVSRSIQQSVRRQVASFSNHGSRNAAASDRYKLELGIHEKELPVLEAAAPDGDGMKVVIRNDGNRFVYIDALSLAFGDKTVGGTELGNMAGRTLIPPGAKREFTVKGVSGQPTLKLLTSAL